MNKGVLVGVVIALLVLAGIGGGLWVTSRSKVASTPATTSPRIPERVGSNQPVSSPVMSDTPTKTAEPAAGTVKDLTVVGTSYKFTPATLTVNKGDTVRITFKSQGGLTHDLVIDEFGVATSQLGDEEEEEVEFVADKAGTFTYYCSVGNHRQMGMVGKLVVQ